MSELTTTKTPAREIRVVEDHTEFSNLLDTAKFEHMYRVSNMFAESTIIPDHYRKNPGNCFIAIQMATRLGVDPFMFMQKTYIVHGKPGMEAQLSIALMNTSGLFENALDYEINCDDPDGDPFDPSYKVRAWAVRKATGKTVVGPWIDWPLVQGEKWDAKEGSKWKTMPGMMFIYRAATFFGRMHCPERLMGMSTADELEDIGMVDVKASPRTHEVAKAIEEAKQETKEPKPETKKPKHETKEPAPETGPGPVNMGADAMPAQAGGAADVKPAAPTAPTVPLSPAGVVAAGTTPPARRGRPPAKPAQEPEAPSEPAAPQPMTPADITTAATLHSRGDLPTIRGELSVASVDPKLRPIMDKAKEKSPFPADVLIGDAPEKDVRRLDFFFQYYRMEAGNATA